MNRARRLQDRGCGGRTNNDKHSVTHRTTDGNGTGSATNHDRGRNGATRNINHGSNGDGNRRHRCNTGDDWGQRNVTMNRRWVTTAATAMSGWALV